MMGIVHHDFQTFNLLLMLVVTGKSVTQIACTVGAEAFITVFAYTDCGNRWMIVTVHESLLFGFLLRRQLSKAS
jgi:hypothetical protein